MTDIFSTAVSTDAPLSMFEQKPGEVGLPANTTSNGPVETNTFYCNMLVDNQTDGIWTQPYSMFYSNLDYWGLAMYHAQASDRVFDTANDPPEYYYSPSNVKELVLSSSDFNAATAFSLQDFGKFSVNARFTVDAGYLECPLVQGMGFITGIYQGVIPQISSYVGFSSITGQTAPKSGIDKYSIELQNSTTWQLYVIPSNGQSVQLKLKDQNNIISSNSVDNCVFQLCFGTDSSYDSAAGCYPTNGSISATVSGSLCTYSLNYDTSGSSNSGTTLLWAFQHQTEVFTSDTQRSDTSFTIDSTTKGTMTACLTNTLSMTETLPTDIGFDPYTTISGNSANYTDNAISAITLAAQDEAPNDVASYSNVDSMYESGKILLKYALVLYTCHLIIKNDSLTNTLLLSMKTAIERFSNNQQQYPLFYDTTYKGIVSSAQGMDDYGNSHYNDHHFHWGYHIYASAITAKVDQDLGGTWLSTVKDWVNTLIRDVANPTTDDTYFPVYRSFDFFNGHSWARGLYTSADGKDEESSSEDYNHIFGMKLWASVIGDSDMENRAMLMLAIIRRSLNKYFLYEDSNTVEPSQIIPNKVSGILMDNKINHTTYFGTNLEYIQGIHMLPTTPISSYIRSSTFVKEEWDQLLSSIWDGLTSGWKGILMLDYALTDPTTAYNFFSDSSFNVDYLDNGMSRTWSLAYCAGVGASS